MVLLAGLEPARCFHQQILLTPAIFIAYSYCSLWSGTSYNHILKDLGDSSMFSTHLEQYVNLVLDCHIDFST